MRWKLASGGIVASTKQPLQNKDFDKIIITTNYDDWYEENGTFVEAGGILSSLSVYIRFQNPSSHTIRKSYHEACGVRLAFGTECVGNIGNKFSSYDPYENHSWTLRDLNPGDCIDLSCQIPPTWGFDRNYTHTINPLTSNWGPKIWSEDPDYAGLQPYQKYNNPTFTQNFACKLRLKTGGGNLCDWYIKERKDYSITYKVR